MGSVRNSAPDQYYYEAEWRYHYEAEWRNNGPKIDSMVSSLTSSAKALCKVVSVLSNRVSGMPAVGVITVYSYAFSIL